MSSLNGYEQWLQLFDKNMSSVWTEEPVPVLKNLSMMVFSINREIKKIQDTLHTDVLHLRNNIADNKLIAESNKNYEIHSHDIENTESPLPQTEENSNTCQNQGPNDCPPKDLSYNESDSIVISDDELDKPENLNNSPEIKKKYRHKDFRKKLKRRRMLNHSTESLLRDLKNATTLDVSGLKENYEENKQNDNSSFDFLKNIAAAYNPCKEIQDNSSICFQIKKHTLKVGTPQKSDGDLDFSIVQCTPVPEKKSKLHSLLLKSRSRKGNNSTLTQMFLKKGKTKDRKQEVRLPHHSDETLSTLSNKKNTMEFESAMGITKMVSFINKENLEDNADSISDANSKLISDDVAKLIASVRYEDFEDTSLNSAMLEEDYSGVSEQNLSEELNDFLAKAQNVPVELEPEPVLRGKARQNLPGWSCKDCEKFYLKQGLNPDEILELNKCSKHRGYYKPREDTLPGFWDMDVRTQETENT